MSQASRTATARARARAVPSAPAAAAARLAEGGGTRRVVGRSGSSTPMESYSGLASARKKRVEKYQRESIGCVSPTQLDWRKIDKDGSGDLDISEVKATLELIDKDGDGNLSIDELRKAFGSDMPELYDIDGDGAIDEREFLMSINLLSKVEGKDVDGDGVVTAEETRMTRIDAGRKMWLQDFIERNRDDLGYYGATYAGVGPKTVYKRMMDVTQAFGGFDLLMKDIENKERLKKRSSSVAVGECLTLDHDVYHRPPRDGRPLLSHQIKHERLFTARTASPINTTRSEQAHLRHALGVKAVGLHIDRPDGCDGPRPSGLTCRVDSLNPYERPHYNHMNKAKGRLGESGNFSRWQDKAARPEVQYMFRP
jgi:hypothetical protein